MSPYRGGQLSLSVLGCLACLGLLLALEVASLDVHQGWAIPGSGQQYYTLYYTGQKCAKIYNNLNKY